MANVFYCDEAAIEVFMITTEISTQPLTFIKFFPDDMLNF